MRGWTGCVIGQNREHYGVILFDSIEAYERYVELGERAQQGDEDAMREAPPHRAINFESKAAMPRTLLKEIQHHRWAVAAGDAFPTVMLVHPDLLLAPPRRADVRQLALVARALVAWLDAEPQLADQWHRLPARRRRFRVPMGTMTLPVTIDALMARIDPSQTPHCTASIIQKHFGVSSCTAHAHAKKVRDLLGIGPFAPDWNLPSLLESSSIPWILEVDGFLQDVRTLPIEIQAEACAKGLIPLVPAMRKQAGVNTPQT